MNWKRVRARNSNTQHSTTQHRDTHSPSWLPYLHAYMHTPHYSILYYMVLPMTFVACFIYSVPHLWHQKMFTDYFVFVQGLMNSIDATPHTNTHSHCLHFCKPIHLGYGFDYSTHWCIPNRWLRVCARCICVCMLVSVCICMYVFVGFLIWFGEKIYSCCNGLT